MGMSYSRCEAQPDPTIVPPPPPGAPGQQGYGGQEAQPPQEPPQYVSEKLKNNPGTYEEVHKKCKDIFPMPFEGAKVMINKPLSQSFQISHSINLSSVTPSGYRFGSTYISPTMVSPTDPAYILIADMDPSANLNAQGIINLSEQIRLKYATQVMGSKFANTQLITDYRGKNFSVSATLANPNLFTGTGIGVVQWLQAISPTLAVGAEVMYQKSPQIPGGAAFIMSLCGRWTGGHSVWSGFAGQAGVGGCYWRRVNEEVQIGIEVENSFIQQNVNIALGYQCELAKANFNMKAMIDNNWTVTGVFEKRLLPMPFLLSICGSLNHVKNQFRLGCGLTIGV